MLILFEDDTPNNMHVVRPFGESGKIIPWKVEAHKKYGRIVHSLIQSAVKHLASAMEV